MKILLLVFDPEILLLRLYPDAIRYRTGKVCAEAFLKCFDPESLLVKLYPDITIEQSKCVHTRMCECLQSGILPALCHLHDNVLFYAIEI